MVDYELDISQGKLRGLIVGNGNKYYKFQGIPYAKPPLGHLRFKAPQPPEKWSGTLDATKEGSPCYSRHTFAKNQLIGSENCLYLNVYTKTITANQPVLFWIHGGGFISGHGGTEMYGPEFLLTENVVLVTLNYRLGLLGFLCLEDSSLEVPGNAGLKDIVMALEWVRGNIAHFGGDPYNVTIFGQSAGGAAVHLLILSKMGVGLFHRAIAQSGCALNPWVRGKRGVYDIAALLKLAPDEKKVYKLLMELPVEELHQIQERMGSMKTCAAHINPPLGYVVEKNTSDPFLDEEPLLLIQSGNFKRVPFIIGYNSAEHTCFDLFIKPNWPGRDTLEDGIPWNWGYQVGSKDSLEVADKIRNFYFGSKPLDQITRQDKIQLHSDANFSYGILLTVLNHCRHQESPIYLYRMNLETEMNIMRQFFKIKIPGTVHYDDVGYLFKNLLAPEVVPGSLEDIAVKRFIRLWTNFAQCGNPTPYDYDWLLDVVWKPVKNAELDFLEIGQRLLALRNPPERRRVDFLMSLYERSPAGRTFKAHF